MWFKAGVGLKSLPHGAISGHFGEALDHEFQTLLTGLGGAGLLEALEDHPPRGRCGTIEFGGGDRTKLQCARDIGREGLLVRFCGGFERDFDSVAGVELGGAEHGHLQDEPALGPAGGREGGAGGLAAVAGENWNVGGAAEGLHDFRRDDDAAQEADPDDASGEGEGTHLIREYTAWRPKLSEGASARPSSLFSRR